MDEKGFALSFATFLEKIPYDLHLPYEAFYQHMLVFCLILGKRPYSVEQQGGTGRLDLHFTTSSNDDVVIEFKYGKPDEGAKKPAKKAIRAALEKLTQAAMKQIDDRKYTVRFQGAGNRIIKMAVAVYDRTNVKAAFEVAENWVLVRGKGGLFQVKKS